MEGEKKSAQVLSRPKKKRDSAPEPDSTGELGNKKKRGGMARAKGGRGKRGGRGQPQRIKTAPCKSRTNTNTPNQIPEDIMHAYSFRTVLQLGGGK